MEHSMLLAVDIGNTNIGFGLFKGDYLLKDWRLHTDPNVTADELFGSFSHLVSFEGIAISEIQAVAISCVVPSMVYAVDLFCQKYLKVKPLIASPEVISDIIDICVDNPQELGIDRLINAVAAFDKYKSDLIVVDFGTATTADYISRSGEYRGGVIAPGVLISCQALFTKAAKLPYTTLFASPRSVIAKNTADAMNAGAVYGFAGMIDGIIRRMKKEIRKPVRVIATGGIAPLIVSESETIKVIEPHLALWGLRFIYYYRQSS